MRGNGFDVPLIKHAAGDSTDSSAGLCVLIGTKAVVAGGTTSSSPSSNMRADNVQDWFTKPGLAGLMATSAQHHDHDQPSLEQQLNSVSAQNPTQYVIERWRGAYEVLVSDAVALGIPQSVIPLLKEEATPEEIQGAVQHLQDMVASFLSAGL